jgi:hypothetical protein
MGMVGRRFSFGLITMGLALFPIWSRADTPENAIKSSVLGCRRQEPGCGRGLIVKVIKIYKDYAKATEARADGQSETDIVYLHKKDGRWFVLDQGTGVNPVELGLPKQVW